MINSCTTMLQDCKNPDNGVIGKCCRDPNYVDPWPAGNLPANYNGGFDEQGFPTFLNIQKTRPTKKPVARPPPKSNRPVKGNPPVKSYQPTEKQFPSFPDFQNQVGGAFNNLFKPTQSPPIQLPSFPTLPTTVAPIDETPNKPFKPEFPTFPNFPTFPEFQTQAPQKNYEPAPSDQNSVAIAPHTPGSQCGVKNSVSGLCSYLPPSK